MQTRYRGNAAKHKRESDCRLADVRLTGLPIRLNSDEYQRIDWSRRELALHCCRRRYTRPCTAGRFDYSRFSVIEQRLSIKGGETSWEDAFSVLARGRTRNLPSNPTRHVHAIARSSSGSPSKWWSRGSLAHKQLSRDERPNRRYVRSVGARRKTKKKHCPLHSLWSTC